MTPAKIYAIANQKGGVGKTTTAINLGAYLAARGQRILLADADPQANATSSLGVDKRALSRSIYDVLVNDTPIEQAMTLTGRLRLDLAPSAPALAGAEVELVALPDREHRLKHALAPVRDRYDLILIDCPPSLGLLTVNALTAADGVLIPVQCEYLALEGLSQLLQTVELVRDSLNPGLHVAGVLLTMHDARTNLSQQVIDEVRGFFGDRVYQTVIPRNVRLSEAPSYGQPILDYAPSSPGAQAYAALADEVLLRAR
ncbi:MAG: AAA family ATPase [Chloroflexi bacterium]|nr:AAA family ATPase [Chloroflexota bacterium]MBU1748035.1 AAA family ATPase [Chloroflexota bacterium]